MASRADIFNVPLPDQWGEKLPEQIGMSDLDLIAMLKREEQSATSFRSSALADEQANALEFYDAKPFGDEVEGQSQVVTPDVAEVVDYMTIAIAEACADGEIVKFKPKVRDPQAVKQATDMAAEATQAVKDAFFDEQDGYSILVGWAQAGLIEKIGVIKAACVTERRNIRRVVTVDAEQLAMLDASGSLVEYSDAPNQPGMMLARVQQQTVRKRYTDTTVPNEEFMFAQRTRDVDNTSYVAQRSRVTRSALVEMGFDRATVDNLPPDSGNDTSWSRGTLEYARWEGRDADDTDRDGPMSEVWLLEEYVRVDRDGDGIAELVQVFRVGETILESTEIDEQPFVVFAPLPRSHRLVGDSVAEKVMDLQRIRSVVARNTIDGVLLSNRPRGQIDIKAIGETTIDDWLTPGPGVLIRTDGSEIKPLTDAFDISQGLGLMQFLVGERESRTGITRLNQGMKSADLDVQTATAFSGLQKQGQRFERYVCRAFGNAVGKLFRKKVRLMIAEGDPLMVEIDGQYHQADPTAWPGDMPIKVRIGIGSEDAEVRLQHWQLLIADQNALRAGGSSLVTDENMYRARDGAIRDMGLGTPNEFYTDPETMGPQEPKPDPNMAKVQADAQTEQQKAAQAHEQAMAKLNMQAQAQQASAALDQQRAEQDAQIKAEAAVADHQRKDAQAALDADLARDKAAMEAGLAQDKQTFEMGLARERFAFDQEMARQRNTQASESDDALPAMRPGGDLAE